MKSSSQHTFARIPSVEIPRSSFKRNMTYKTTFNAGYLIPFYLDEVLPGDTFNFKLASFARILSPLKYPIMDNLYMDFQFFFVPVRLVYDDYEKFFGSSKGQAGHWEFDDSHTLPQVDFNSGVDTGTIGDYFGLPCTGVKLKVNALPFRAYNKIINDWYLPSVYELTGPTIKTDSTDDNKSYYQTPWKRIKRCDYFTSALTSPQRGPGAELAIGGYADIVYGGSPSDPYYCRNTSSNTTVNIGANTIPSGLIGTKAVWRVNSSNEQTMVGGKGTDTTEANRANELGRVITGSPASYTLRADLSTSTAVSINSLRQAFQLQRLLERDMRGGVQYVNILMSHFGVRSPDARLQRTEYLGGGSVPVNIHTVANTTGFDSDTGGNAQGKLAAFGVAGSSNIGWIKSFTEHGYVLGIVSVRADLTYQHGVPRLFDRKSRYDFFYPVFDHLGEQAILNKEIFARGYNQTDASGAVYDEQVFGYQERYAEYRYGVSKITGQLNSNYAQTLDAWHLAQKFNNAPTLNATFLYEDVPMSRVKADTDAPDFIFDALISCNCVRPMSLFGVPGLVDHF